MSITMSQLASRYAAASKQTPGSKELKALAQVGVGLVKNEIQNYHAVDTGTMLNSTTSETAGIGVSLACRGRCALYVE